MAALGVEETADVKQKDKRTRKTMTTIGLWGDFFSAMCTVSFTPKRSPYCIILYGVIFNCVESNQTTTLV